MKKRLIFKVKKDGSVEMEANGYHGQECMAASEPFMKLFQVEETDLKMEYYDEAEADQDVKAENE